MTHFAQLPTPNTFPASVGFRGVNFTSNVPKLVYQANNARDYTVTVASQYWSFTLPYPDMTLDQHRVLNAFILRHESIGNPVEVTIPYIRPLSGDILDTSATVIDSGQTGSSLVIKNWNYATNLTPGDYFRLGSSGKVYQVTNYQKVGSSVFLEMFPPLVEPTANRPLQTDFIYNLQVAPTAGLAAIPTVNQVRDQGSPFAYRIGDHVQFVAIKYRNSASPNITSDFPSGNQFGYALNLPTKIKPTAVSQYTWIDIPSPGLTANQHTYTLVSTGFATNTDGSLRGDTIQVSDIQFRVRANLVNTYSHRVDSDLIVSGFTVACKESINV